MLTIRKWVRITPKEAVVNGVPIRINPTDDPLPVALYRQRVGNYPKFFKMDPLCRVGFVASELLLEGEPQRFEPRDDRTVVLFSRSGSFASDSLYERTIADPAEFYPSPAIFVYTLANILTGEIAIRNKYYGETACYLLDRNELETMVATVRETLIDKATQSVLCGWVDSPDAECFEAEWFLVERSDEGIEWNTTSIDKIMNYK